MELDQILKTATQLLDQIKIKDAEVKAAAEINLVNGKRLTDREKEVVEREKAIGAIEGAKALLDQAQELKASVHTDRQLLEKDRADFSNYLIVERQKIKAERDALLPLIEQAEQVRRDKAALEAEKASYKEKIKKELIDGLKK